MATDAVLAIAHHLLVFAIAGLIAAEFVLVRRDITSRTARMLARADAGIGGLALLIVIVGFARVFTGVRPESFYLENPIFWLKMAAFVAVGVLSVIPTRVFLRWAKVARAGGAFAVSPAEVARVQQILWAEVGLFALIPTFAALMARGYGL